MVLEIEGQAADPVDAVAGVEAESDVAATDPAGQDPVISRQLLHKVEGVARCVLVDGEAQRAGSVLLARGPGSEVFLVGENELLEDGLSEFAKDGLGG